MLKKASRFAMGVDLFGQNVTFRENKGQSFSTLCGSFISILIISIVAFYGANKTVILKEKEDTN